MAGLDGAVGLSRRRADNDRLRRVDGSLMQWRVIVIDGSCPASVRTDSGKTLTVELGVHAAREPAGVIS